MYTRIAELIPFKQSEEKYDYNWMGIFFYVQFSNKIKLTTLVAKELKM